MLKRMLAVLALAAPLAASPLHSNDPNYHGAFTVLAAANLTGATAKYTTQIVFSNLSGHAVHVRLEFYGTNGYREGILYNTFDAGGVSAEAGGFWGGRNAVAEYTDILGTGAAGALRVVAVNESGEEDPVAVLHGYARLWIEPASGGRISEYVPGLTDYEASGGFRASRLGAQYIPFTIDVRPFATALDDRTYGGSRVNLGLVNFDREHDATITVGDRTATSAWGNMVHADAIHITVPAGSMRQVAIPLLSYDGYQPNPNLPLDNPLMLQDFAVILTSPTGPWAAYASVVDGVTSSSTFILDPFTGARQ